MKFSQNYPANAPHCVFDPVVFHPNVFSSGSVCLSILNSEWKPSITIKQILLGIQELLDTPNPKSPANHEAYETFRRDKNEYNRRVGECVKRSVAMLNAAAAATAKSGPVGSATNSISID